MAVCGCSTSFSRGYRTDVCRVRSWRVSCCLTPVPYISFHSRFIRSSVAFDSVRVLHVFTRSDDNADWSKPTFSAGGVHGWNRHHFKLKIFAWPRLLTLMANKRYIQYSKKLVVGYEVRNETNTDITTFWISGGLIHCTRSHSTYRSGKHFRNPCHYLRGMVGIWMSNDALVRGVFRWVTSLLSIPSMFVQ